VLGARRPGAHAWNLVVLGLLLVNLLPLAGALIRGLQFELDMIWIICVAGTIAVGVINYLPTRLSPAAGLLALGGGLECLAVISPASEREIHTAISWIGLLLISLVPWVAYTSLRSPPLPPSRFDQRWLDFRDRFGLVWSERLRDQFNRSAAHAGWPVVLRWQGLRLKPGTSLADDKVQDEMLETLRALMKRF
jgi:hypothetical protein